MTKVPLKRKPHPEPQRGERIIVTLLHNEKEKLEAAAKAKGLPTSLWARMVLLEAVKS